MKKKNTLPNFCFGYLLEQNGLPVDKQDVTRIVWGEQGYRKPGMTGGRDEAMRQNAELGVTVQQMEAMIAGSMFGFDIPAADPSMYDEKGDLRTDVEVPKPTKAELAEKMDRQIGKLVELTCGQQEWDEDKFYETLEDSVGDYDWQKRLAKLVSALSYCVEQRTTKGMTQD